MKVADIERKLKATEEKYQAAQKDLDAAVKNFRNARAKLDETQKDLQTARDKYRDAESLLQIKLKELELIESQRTLTAKDITKGLLTTKTDAKSGVNLYINFEFNNSHLIAQGRVQADQLAAALDDPVFQGRTFTVIGHTDKRGSEEYNQELSERRAEAVKQYMVENYGIDPDRIHVEGRARDRTIA